MKRLLLVSLVVVFALLSLGEACGQDYSGSVLPSEQTAENLGQLPSVTDAPELRYAPGESGNANKESWLPVGDVNLLVVLLMLLASGYYVLMQTKKKKRANEN